MAFFEYRDKTLRVEDDVVRLFDLPVLASIPLMVTPDERRRHRRRTIYAGLATVFLVIGTAALAAWKLRLLF
jgi:hypothetical protein